MSVKMESTPCGRRWFFGVERHVERRGFSLVEVLTAVTIIGILVFLALPNIVQVKTDSEQHLATARAEALNLSMASYLQAYGTIAASSGWTGAASDQDKYTLLTAYLAFAPSNLTDYMPGGYSATFPSALLPLTKVTLTGPNGTIGY